MRTDSNRLFKLTLTGILTAISAFVVLTIKEAEKEKSESSRLSKSAIESQSSSSNNSLPVNSGIDAIVDSRDNASTKNTYVPDSVDLNKMSTMSGSDIAMGLSNTLPTKAVYYMGVEVDSLKRSYNAKLVGVDNYNIEYYYGSEISTYFAKGLLFELSGTKLVSLVGHENSFFVGQRYDISYHPFKKDVNISKSDLLKMCLRGHNQTTIINQYDAKYDGFLVDYTLNKKGK